MNISNSSIPSTISGIPTGNSTSEGAEPGSEGAFALLLPTDPGADAKDPNADAGALTSGQNGMSSGEPETEQETGDGSKPTPAEQMNLAALLYARPAVDAPLPGKAIASPAMNLEGASIPLTPEYQTAGNSSVETPAGSRDQPAGTPPALENFQAPAVPAPVTHSRGMTAPMQGRDPRSKESGAGLSETPAQAPAVAKMAPLDAAVAHVPQTAQTAQVANVAPLPNPTAPAPAKETGAEVVKRLETLAANFAAAPLTKTNGSKNDPANSAPATLPSTTSELGEIVSQSPANTDGSLPPEGNLSWKTTRGTPGAKAGRDMSETSSIQPTSHPDASVSRSVSSGMVAGTATSEEKSLGQSKMDAQDLAPADRSAANRPGSEPSFSISSPALPSPTVRSEASHKTVESAPMSTAAIVQELGHGLDRIQQHGSHRVDLRLSLEGGGEVSIALQMRDGAVHASFQTASPELREALQQGWAQMANRENQPIPLADPVFKSPSTTPNNAGQQDPRERREEQPAGDQRQAPPVFPATPHQTHRAVQPPAPARTATSGLNAWA